MKKITTVAICAILMLNLTGHAFVDVSDSKLADSLKNLTEFSIINGYADGTFKPDNNITRAEFSKIITTAIMVNNLEYTVDTAFEDVSDTDWAKDYIYISKNLGIVNGTSPTTFDPESNITYEQAIKMVVVGLGYDIEAQQFGGYPDGYITVANQLGILSDIKFSIEDYATRGSIAFIISNALNVPFYTLSTNGVNISRELSDLLLIEKHTALISSTTDKDEEITDEIPIVTSPNTNDQDNIYDEYYNNAGNYDYLEDENEDEE